MLFKWKISIHKRPLKFSASAPEVKTELQKLYRTNLQLPNKSKLQSHYTQLQYYLHYILS